MERPSRPDVIEALIAKVNSETLNKEDLKLIGLDVLKTLEYIEKLEVFWE